MGRPTFRLFCKHQSIPLLTVLNVEKIMPSLYDGGKDDFRDVRNMGLGWAGRKALGQPFRPTNTYSKIIQAILR